MDESGIRRAGAALMTVAACVAGLCAAGVGAAWAQSSVPAPPVPSASVPEGARSRLPFDPWDTVVPLTGSVRLEPIRERDPDGGPPWGIRTFVAPSGRTCVDVGRIVGNRLGDVGSGGRFTERPFVTINCRMRARPGVGEGTYGYGARLTNVDPGGCRLPADRRPESAELPPCNDRHQRTVIDAAFGRDLVRVIHAEADGTRVRALAIGPRGDFVAVRRGMLTAATEPILMLTFDSGCTRLGRKRLQFPGAYRTGCEVIVPDLFGQDAFGARKRAAATVSRCAAKTAARAVTRRSRRIGC